MNLLDHYPTLSVNSLPDMTLLQETSNTPPDCPLIAYQNPCNHGVKQRPRLPVHHRIMCLLHY